MGRVGRIGWIEVARVLGALGVVMLHVFTSAIWAADFELSTMRMTVYAIFGIVFGRWAVPAFFMITGFLLLDPARQVGWQQVRRYAGRMALVLATFGFLFALMEETSYCLADGDPLSPAILVSSVYDVLTASSWDHLWYVYALVFVYLLVPLVRLIWQRVGERGFTVFSLVFFVVAMVVPTLVRLVIVAGGGEVEIPQQGLVSLLLNVVVGMSCLCLGGCLRTWLREERYLKPIVVAGVVSLVAMLVVSIAWQDNEYIGFIILQGSCFACAYALFILVMLYKLVGEDQVRDGSAIEALAQDSFGIYVLHPVFVHVLLLAVNPLDYPPVVFEVVFYAVVLTASVIATRLVRRVPVVGDLL